MGAGLVEGWEGRHLVCTWEVIMFVGYGLGMVTRLVFRRGRPVVL